MQINLVFFGLAAAWLQGTTAHPLLADAAASDLQARHARCTSKLVMLSARGSGLPPGPGEMGAVADAVEKAVPHTSPATLAVQYAATIPNYALSVGGGVRDLRAQIQYLVNACPDVDLVLYGYSQGAQVVMDTVFGTFPVPNWQQVEYIANKPLEAKYLNRIKAIVVMGDPTHNRRQAFTEGTSHSDGEYPRQVNYQGYPLANKMRSFCDSGDPVCSLGHDMNVHNSYLNRYKDDAVKFTLEMLR